MSSMAMSKSRKVVSYGAQYTVLVIVAIVVLAPMVLLIMGGLKTRGEVMTSPYTLPNPPRFENWSGILTNPTFSFWRMMGNSLIVMTVTTIGVLVISSMTAFVFSRMAFRGRD